MKTAVEPVARGKCPVSAATRLRDPRRLGRKSWPEVTKHWWKQLSKDNVSRLLDGAPLGKLWLNLSPKRRDYRMRGNTCRTRAHHNALGTVQDRSVHYAGHATA